MSTPPRIAAIPTTYKGVKFRSKLEAAWAEWFDSKGIEWTFEQEGYQLPSGTWYLPDFWLPRVKTFVEVKGFLDDSVEKPIELAKAIAGIHPPITVVLASAPAGKKFWLITPQGIDDGTRSVFVECDTCKVSYFAFSDSKFCSHNLKYKSSLVYRDTLHNKCDHLKYNAHGPCPNDIKHSVSVKGSDDSTGVCRTHLLKQIAYIIYTQVLDQRAIGNKSTDDLKQLNRMILVDGKPWDSMMSPMAINCVMMMGMYLDYLYNLDGDQYFDTQNSDIRISWHRHDPRNSRHLVWVFTSIVIFDRSLNLCNGLVIRDVIVTSSPHVGRIEPGSEWPEGLQWCLAPTPFIPTKKGWMDLHDALTHEVILSEIK